MKNQPQLLVALTLALASGAAALAHQLLWTRRLVDVLGASAGTFSKVIGAFFIGLALGAWLASGRETRRVDFWRRVALAELAVAGLALPVLFAAPFAEWLHVQGVPGRALKFLWPLLLVAPPAVAMGLVVPWMARALAGTRAFQSTQAVWLYAANTLGGVLGLCMVVFVALPWLGLTGTGLGAVSLNLLVAGGAFALALARHPAEEHPSRPEAGERKAGLAAAAAAVFPEWTVRLLAFASGFLVLALEVLLQHQLAQVSINSLFSSAVVLALVLASLGVAAAAAPRWTRWCGNHPAALASALVVAAVLCASEPFVFTGLRGGVNILPYELRPLPYTWEVLKLGLLTMSPLLLAGGLVFPLLLRQAAESVRRGRNPVALLLAWNGLGGWLGAELGQSLIAPVSGLWGGMVLIAGGYFLLFAVVKLFVLNSPPLPRPWPGRGPQLVSLLLATAGLVCCGWLAHRRLPQATVAPAEKLAALAVGREGVVATLECGPGDWRMLFNNSYTLGGSKAQFNQERQALLPLLLHGHPKTVAALGVATGSSVAGATLHPGVERVDAVELSPLVLKYAEEFFGPYNRNVFRDARVRFIPEDARWIMAGQRAAHDVVVGDLFLPWRTGEGRLFALEHFENVRAALRPDGVFCQWLPLFQLTRPQFDAIARTFLRVFPEAFLVRGDFYSEQPIIGLVGGRKLENIDWSAVRAGCEALRTAGESTDPLMRHVEGLAMMIIGPLPEPPPGPVNTLANAWLEWDAGRNILGLRTPWFIGIPAAEYVRDIQRAAQPLLPPELRGAHDAGQFFLTLEVAARLNLDVLAQLKAQISHRLPERLQADDRADWRQWPMRIKPLVPPPALATPPENAGR